MAGKRRPLSSSPTTASGPAIAVLEAADIWKSYGGVTALRGANLHLVAGEVLGFVGANGAGKSTLVRILTGDTLPDRGRISLDGVERSFTTVDEAHKHGIGFVPQELDLVPDLSVAANIMLNVESRYSRYGLIQRPVLEREAERLLERVGLAVGPRAELSSLSLGDRQLVAVARAVRDAAKALILDEPTSSLTPWEAHRLLELVRSLADDGVAACSSRIASARSSRSAIGSPCCATVRSSQNSTGPAPIFRASRQLWSRRHAPLDPRSARHVSAVMSS